MAKQLYGLAALLSGLIGLAHMVSGGAIIVPPLFASTDVPENVAALSYFVWHCGSVSILAMLIAYTYAAMRPGGRPMAMLATLIAFGFGVVGLGSAAFVSGTLWGTPAPYVFSIIGLVALVAIATDKRTA